MTVEEFLEEFNYAPYDHLELAAIASQVDGKLGVVAKNLTADFAAFEDILEEIGFTWG